MMHTNRKGFPQNLSIPPTPYPSTREQEQKNPYKIPNAGSGPSHIYPSLTGPSFSSTTLGVKEKELFISDSFIQNETKKLLLKQINEEAKQAELRTALLAAQVKYAEIQNQQLMQNLEMSKSGVVQKLLELQMEADATRVKKTEVYNSHQAKIAEITASRLEKEENQNNKADEDFKKTTQHMMFR